MSFAINIPAAPLASFFYYFLPPFFFCNIGRNQQKYLTKFFVLGLQKIPWVSRQISLSAFFVTQYLWNVVIKPRWSECSFLNNKTGEAMKGKFFFFFFKKEAAEASELIYVIFLLKTMSIQDSNLKPAPLA